MDKKEINFETINLLYFLMFFMKSLVIYQIFISYSVLLCNEKMAIYLLFIINAITMGKKRKTQSSLTRIFVIIDKKWSGKK